MKSCLVTATDAFQKILQPFKSLLDMYPYPPMAEVYKSYT